MLLGVSTNLSLRLLKRSPIIPQLFILIELLGIKVKKIDHLFPKPGDCGDNIDYYSLNCLKKYFFLPI